MSNHDSRPAPTADRPAPRTRPAAPRTSTDRPTATYPVRRSILRPDRHSRPATSHSPSPFVGWRDQVPTELLPAVPGLLVPQAQTRRRTAPSPRTDRLARRLERLARAERRRRHLRRALAGILVAIALLTGLQLYAAAGITQARQAALAASSARRDSATEQASRRDAAAPQTEGAEQAAPSSTMSGQTSSQTPSQSSSKSPHMSGQTDTQADWVTEDTRAPYVRTNPHASPLADLPRCTTSPTTPMPCLAHVSADSRRVVILEEDASLTALVRH